MSEDFKIQLSFKPKGQNGRLDNLRGNTWEEMDYLLAGYGDRVAMINAIENLAMSGVAGAITPSVSAPVSAVPAAPEPVPQAAPAPAAPAGQTCKHGAMTYREGQGKRGPWRAYMCPAPKGAPDQCEPQFLR